MELIVEPLVDLEPVLLPLLQPVERLELVVGGVELPLELGGIPLRELLGGQRLVTGPAHAARRRSARLASAPFRRLEGLRISNVYLLDGGRGERWLIDAGHALERVALLAALRRAGVRPSDLQGILLTHRHSDHAGNARFLKRRYGLRIHAHRADAEVLGGSAPRPVMRRGSGSLVAGLFARLENLWPARVDVDRALDDGEVVAGLEVHWAPGHTEGSVLYRHAPGGTLISGDMLLTAAPPLTLSEGLCLPYPTYTWDMARARASLAAFHAKGLPYENLLAGHGPPLVGGARGRVVRLLEESGVLPPGQEDRGGRP